MERVLVLGLFYGIAAGMLWGLAFPIPAMMMSFSAVEITFGRFLIFGVISGLMLVDRWEFVRGLSRHCWTMAFLFAFTGNISYFVLLATGIQLAGAVIATLIIGALPITISLYGNWLNREFSFTRVVPSVLVIAAGLVVINIPALAGGVGEWNFLGLLCCLASLLIWTWYGVANAGFLKENPNISSKDWASVTGVATLILLPLFLAGANLAAASPVDFTRMFFSADRWNYWLGSTALGVLASWGGLLLWNKASQLLPVSLAGQLIVGETIFGLIYVFLIEQRLPRFEELLGGLLTIGGVLVGFRMINRLKEGAHDGGREQVKSG